MLDSPKSLARASVLNTLVLAAEGEAGTTT